LVGWGAPMDQLPILSGGPLFRGRTKILQPKRPVLFDSGQNAF